MDARYGAQRIKRHHPKVRTGCQVCKQRRVKCDEQHPTCGPCARGRRKCEYLVPKAWVFEPSPQTLNAQNNPSTAIRPPHLTITKEVLDFRFFLENSLPLLCSIAATPETVAFNPSPSLFFNKQGTPLIGVSTEAFNRFWRRLVPQFAYQNPAIWKLVCLYGSKQRAAICHTIQDVPTTNMQGYSAALSLLASSATPSSPDNVMMASMVLFAFERLRAITEPNDNGFLHLKATLRLMDEYPDHFIVTEYMKPVRCHMNAVVSFFKASCRPLLSSPPPHEFNIESDVASLPAAFKTCFEARDRFADLCNMPRRCGCSVGRAWNRDCLSYQSTKESMDLWCRLMLDHYNQTRGVDVKEATAAFTLLAEGYLFNIALELSVRDMMTTTTTPTMTNGSIPPSTSSPSSSTASRSSPSAIPYRNASNSIYEHFRSQYPRTPPQ